MKSINLNIYSVQFFLLCLIPLALVFSRFFADFFVVIICILFIANSLIEKKTYFNNIFFKIFLLFWIVISLRSLFSEDIYFSFKSSFTFIRFAILALAINYLIKSEPKRIYLLFLTVILSLLLVAIDGLYQFFNGRNIFGFEQITAGRVSGFFKDELILGSYISRLAPIFIGAYFYCKYLKLIKKNYDYIFFIVSIVLLFTVIISGERVSTVYIFITVFFSLFFFNIQKKYKILITLLTIFLLIFIFIKSKNISNRYLMIFDQLGLSKLEYKEDSKIYFMSSDHHHHAIAAYKIFKENILFGSGAKMFRVICDKRYKEVNNSCTTHPHNIVMQFLSETGFLGFLFYVFSLFYVLSQMIKIIKKKIIGSITDNYKARFFYLVALLISLFPVLPSGNFFNNWIAILSFLGLGMYLSTTKLSSKC
jgi:O-antigen ligase